MDLYGVIGNPIAHSRSPQLHNAAFEALGLEARYVRIASRDAAGALATGRRMEVKGLNVTAPYKEVVARLVVDRDPIVRAIGAANTLIRRGDDWTAHNTDVAGVQGALRRSNVPVRDARALVLGAGGAALAAAMALRIEGAEVTVAARNPAGARRVAGLVGCAASSLQEANGIVPHARVIVSAVSTADPVIDPGALQQGTFVLDARYQSESALVRAARETGCVIVDGREWLLCQAADAFQLFTGRPPPPGVMQRSLHQERVACGSIVSLVGFMGSGKTSVARALGDRLGLPVLDTDSLVAQLAGMPVDRLLRELGEPALRRCELEALQRIPDSPAVLACGGGLITSPQATRLLRDKSRLVVWLWAGAASCLERIGDATSRPLLGTDPESSVPRLLNQRRGAYASSCDVVVDTEHDSVADVADAARELWRECP